MGKNLHMSDERYLAALYRQRDRIIMGLPFVAEDSDAPGAKYTHASWGLCSRDAEAWPDRDDHLWPEQFDTGRVAPMYRHQHQTCPMQKKAGPNGCFYSCMIFKSGEVSRRTPAKAIDLYEQAIAKARKGVAEAPISTPAPETHRGGKKAAEA